MFTTRYLTSRLKLFYFLEAVKHSYPHKIYKETTATEILNHGLSRNTEHSQTSQYLRSWQQMNCRGRAVLKGLTVICVGCFKVMILSLKCYR